MGYQSSLRGITRGIAFGFWWGCARKNLTGLIVTLFNALRVTGLLGAVSTAQHTHRSVTPLERP